MDNNPTIIRQFLDWTKLKIMIHLSGDIEFYFREREIWWASLGINIGHEQDGKNNKFERPVLILKKFNRHVLWILPFTNKTKLGKYYYQTKYQDRDYWIILSQLRLISSKRLTRKIRTLPKNEYFQVKQRIKLFI